MLTLDYKWTVHASFSDDCEGNMYPGQEQPTQTLQYEPKHFYLCKHIV